MQRLKEEKRQAILRAAGRMFAARPYHEVRLQDIAAHAKVGKGTLYGYVKSKEDLYHTLILDEFSHLVNQLSQEIEGSDMTPRDALRRIVEALVAFTAQRPSLFAAINPLGKARSRWQARREQLASLIASVVRRGNKEGSMHDPHPELTGLCVPGLIRSVFLFGTQCTQAAIVSRLLHFIEHGVSAKDA